MSKAADDTVPPSAAVTSDKSNVLAWLVLVDRLLLRVAAQEADRRSHGLSPDQERHLLGLVARLEERLASSDPVGESVSSSGGATLGAHANEREVPSTFLPGHDHEAQDEVVYEQERSLERVSQMERQR
ncbi:MAG: hypothetical protein U0869_07705 [Chloroflexota bacterium]